MTDIRCAGRGRPKKNDEAKDRRRNEIWRNIMIGFIRSHQWYEAGTLEAMPEEQLREIYERVLDWIKE